jgi:hypothetical protein
MPRKSKNQEKNSEEASDQPNTWSEVQQVRKWMRHQSTNGALHQVFRANPDRMPQRLPEPDPMLSTTGFLNSFLPSDGQESAIARLIVALTNTAMDLFARANTLESPAREAELSLAVRLPTRSPLSARPWIIIAVAIGPPTSMILPEQTIAPVPVANEQG